MFLEERKKKHIKQKLGPQEVKSSERITQHTYPNANADNHGYFGGAVVERFERVDCDVTAVPTHRSQGDARGLHRHLTKKEKS